MKKDPDILMRKRNMKLFPTYKKLAWDFIFFYTINFLFLTQIKKINPADVVLIDAFYSLFGVVAQMPSAFIVEFLGRRNSIILGNVLNCLYMVIIIFSQNLFHLITAEIICSLAFAIKESAEPSLLNESIPPSKVKSQIFSRINEKGASGYYRMNAISTILAGWLFEINGYLPIILSFTVLGIVTILSTFFIEPVKKKKMNWKEISLTGQIKEIEEAFHFILKSERVKSLILYVAVTAGILCILDTYQISLLEDLKVSPMIIGILFAILGIISSIGSGKQQQFHEKYHNRSLKILGFGIALCCLFAGIAGIFAVDLRWGVGIIFLAYGIRYTLSGIYYNLIEKYLRNFANEKIDTKIFTAKNLLKSVSCAISGVLASILLDRMDTAYCMIIIGGIFTILMLLLSFYMKRRVGLKPEEYSKEEIKYDELNLTN